MSNILLATYPGKQEGEYTVRKLMDEADVPRQNIGLAFEEGVEGQARSLVTVSTHKAHPDKIRKVLKDNNPLKMGERDFQWLEDQQGDDEFDIESFTATDKW